MSSTVQQTIPRANPIVSTMKALVFRGTGQIGIEQVPITKPGPGEAVIRVTLTTISGTDLHNLRGEYPVKPGLTVGHEPVGVIHELGVGVTGYQIGDRVLVGVITPCGQCDFCLSAACEPNSGSVFPSLSTKAHSSRGGRCCHAIKVGDSTVRRLFPSGYCESRDATPLAGRRSPAMARLNLPAVVSRRKPLPDSAR